MDYRKTQLQQAFPVLRGGGWLVAHSYIINDSKETVILYSSVSDFRNIDNEQRKIIGYANRYLTYRDMIYFKEKGYKYYDLGCIGFEEQYNNQDPSIWPIVKFKRGFGGEIVKYYQYAPHKTTKRICKQILKIKNLFLSK